MNQRDICRFMEESCGLEVDREMVSRATEAVVEDIKTWQTRPMEGTYIAAWLDAMIVKTTENNSVQNRTVYIAVGLTGEKTKDVLDP